MNLLHLVLIGIGGFFGSISRFSLSYLFVKIGWVNFPWATLLVNLLGSFLIGMAFGLLLENEDYPEHYKLFFATGFLGSFTTFSTFSFETFEMVNNHLYLQAALYSLGSILIGVLLAYGGYSLVKA
jgi:CrcB protein